MVQGSKKYLIRTVISSNPKRRKNLSLKGSSIFFSPGFEVKKIMK